MEASSNSNGTKATRWTSTRGPLDPAQSSTSAAKNERARRHCLVSTGRPRRHDEASARRSSPVPCANRFVHAHAGTISPRFSMRSTRCPVRNASQSSISTAPGESFPLLGRPGPSGESVRSFARLRPRSGHRAGMVPYHHTQDHLFPVSWARTSSHRGGELRAPRRDHSPADGPFKRT
jgi:hypothetical protein